MSPSVGCANGLESFFPSQVGEIGGDHQGAMKQALDFRDEHPVFLALRPVASVPVKARKFHGPAAYSFV
jgi:hypothetical protein